MRNTSLLYPLFVILLFPSLIYTQDNPRFKIFKTIRVGNSMRNANDFLLALRDKKMLCHIPEMLNNSKFTVSNIPQEVDLVVVSLGDLGFVNRDETTITTLENIYSRAKNRGLELCPIEVGPQLRLQYENQPASQELIIAMEPIIFQNDFIKGWPIVFSLSRCEISHWKERERLKANYFLELSYRTGCKYGDIVAYPIESQFVFVLPRRNGHN